MTALDELMGILLPILEQFEGFRPRPYLCSAGVPTIGIGSTRYLDGRRVTLSDPPITREHALLLCRQQVLTDYLPDVLKLCQGLDTSHRVAAISSWAYNLGIGSLRASTMRRRINERAWSAAKVECKRWNRAAGRIVAGLVKRREAEAALL